MRSIPQKGCALLCGTSYGCPSEYLSRLLRPISRLFKPYLPLRGAVCLLKELATCKGAVFYTTVSLTEQAMCFNPGVCFINMEHRLEMPTTAQTDSYGSLGTILQNDGSSFSVQDIGLDLGILRNIKGKQ